MEFGTYLQKPLWDPSNFTYGNFNFNFNNNMFGGFQAPIWPPVSSSTNTDSYESWKKKQKENAEKGEIDSEFLKEKEQELSKTRELLEIQNKKIEAVKKGKKSDGRSIVEVEKLQDAQFKKDGTIDKAAMKPKKKGFWDKAAEWGSSALSAVTNIGKAFIGMDENGKINPLKALKNVAITAAAVGACFIPVVGPVIGAGLLAYGVGTGAVGVYKGVKKLNRARTEEERETARQEVCSGAIVGAASVVGMRGLGKAFRTGANASNASVATARTGFFGKAAQYTSQSARDITVNAFRGTKAAMSADKALIASKGGGFGGFRKAYGHKVAEAWQGFNSWEKRYDKKLQDVETSYNQRMAEIERQLQNTNIDSSLRTSLNAERTALEEQITNLEYFKLCKTKTEFDQLKTNNTCSKELKKLIELKENVMRVKAKHPDKYTPELAEYIPSPDVKKSWWKPSTWRKNEYQLTIGGKNPGKWGEIAKISTTSPASSIPLSFAVWNETFSTPMLGNLIEMTAEQTEEYLKQLEQEKQQLENALKTIEAVDDSAKWNQIKAQAKAEQEAAAQQSSGG